MHLIVQAGLILHQGYIPEKHYANQDHVYWTQNSHLKQCISCGLGDGQPHPICCMTVPLVDIQTCQVYMYCVYCIHTFICNVFIYL